MICKKNFIRIVKQKIKGKQTSTSWFERKEFSPKKKDEKKQNYWVVACFDDDGW